MSLLQTLGKGQGYLKAGFLGFQGSGKTYTAVLLAIGVRQAFKLKGPIAFVDTENATEYVAPLVRSLTGLDLVGLRSRKFQDLLDISKECVDAGASVLVADSMTHFWRALCDAYLAGVNERRQRFAQQKGWKNFTPQRALEFQDWAHVKGEWAKWTEAYLNLPLHIVICGRAGYEYDMEVNEDTKKKELIKTGIKMKTEGEFGFEPSLLVQMDTEQSPDPEHKGRFLHCRTATVTKDRFAVIDGKTFAFPGCDGDKKAELKAVMDAFGPHVDMLKPGAHSTVETNVGQLDVDADGDVEWARERKVREILCEEIQGAITSAIPGLGGEDKKRKADLLNTVFGTRSWTAVQSMDSDKLRAGLGKLRVALGETGPAAIETDDGSDLGPQNSTPAVSQPATGHEPAREKQPDQQQASAHSEPDASHTAAGVDPIIAAVGDANLAAAVTWMARNKWITSEAAMSENPFAGLTEAHRQSILKSPARFLRAIGA